MKSLSIAAALGAFLAIADVSFASEDMQDMKDVDGPGSAAAAAVHKASAVVRSVQAEAGQVTLEHGPVPSLNWPSMTMAFAVKDKALLGKLQVGKKVNFEFVQEGSKYVVTRVK